MQIIIPIISILMFTFVGTIITKPTPASVIGICHKIHTLAIPKVEERSQAEGSINIWQHKFTAASYHVDSGKVVVKFQVHLKDICKNLSKTMKMVKSDIKRLMFRRRHVRADLGLVQSSENDPK